MSSAAPSIPLFGDAYLADTHHLTLEEHGAYLKLLMIAWRMDGCALPDNDMRLAKMLGVTGGKWAKLKPIVMAFWKLGENGWFQARLSKERAFVDRKREQNKSAADARWAGQATENKGAEECERTSERNAPPPPPPEVREEAEAAPQSRIAVQPVAEALAIWNESAGAVGWRVVIKFHPTRQAALRARLRADGIDGWRDAIARARASPYLAAQPPPPWFTFDFIVKPGNFAKLIEGNYDGTGQQRQQPANDGLGPTVRAALQAKRIIDERARHI